MTEAALDAAAVTGDVYVVAGRPGSPTAAGPCACSYKPFIVWIWGGCVLMALGGASRCPTGATGCRLARRPR
jgi:cytochrome c-type biogenesis protein CcmF